MCGIIGVLANERPAIPIVVDALRRLEYRGYDSAGVGAVDCGHLNRRRAQGKLAALIDLLDQNPLPGSSGIGHTRWATHGSPTESNAHPHRSGPVCVVHNGIIENYQTLRSELAAAGATFESETDSEVIATLCAALLRLGLGHEEAAKETLARLKGAYALCFLFENAPDMLICARRGSPLVIGFGESEVFVGSDAIALAPMTNRICYLEDGDWAVVTRSGVGIHDASGSLVERPVQTVPLESLLADKGEHRHFMAKEISEQPTVAARALGAWTSADRSQVRSAAEAIDWSTVSRLTIVACGTAYLAGHVAKIWIEKLARLPVEIEVASEFRYREPPLSAGDLTMVISQSGETADTLAALRYAKAAGQKILALVNVTTSTIAREADVVLATHAGPEIGVASTKAFTAQMICLAAFTLMVARRRGMLDADDEEAAIKTLSSVPRVMAETIALEPHFADLAAEISVASSVLFLGRGMMFPLALEGALKLKEITYIHAEGYAAGEIKHGPIALVDEATPVIALVPAGELMDKTLSNLREVVARKGRVAVIGSATACRDFGDAAWRCVALPDADALIEPFSYAVAIQFLAYHAAITRGTDVDQPRNLAKSVTVE